MVTISQIKRLLPNTQKRKWSLQKHRAEARQTHCWFPEFFQSFLEEKLAMEYLKNDIRESISQAGSSNKVRKILGGILDHSNKANRSNEPVSTL